MEPRIQYATTNDGVSIAYWTIGEGSPLVHLPTGPYSHPQLEWRWPEVRRWYERLARDRRLIRYDSRGTGLSDRQVTNYSLDALVLDLETVLDRLELETCALFGLVHGGPVAIAYAARHSERVSHLVLWCSYATGAAYFGSQHVQGVVDLVDRDWGLFTETVAHAALGWSESEQARRFAAFYRESTPWEVARAAYRVLREIDVRALLSKVKVPTLVIQRRQVPWAEVNLARELASGIPGARLALLEGTSLAAYLGDTEETATAIDEFLGDSAKRVPSIEAPAPGGPISVILFTDMEASTALTQRLGDAEAQKLVRTHNGIVRDALRTHDGTEIKHTGDGIMASFMSASRAVACALAIQQAVAAYTEHHADTPLRVRIGLNAGEPVAEEGDLFGTAVQLAARIRDLSQPGQVVASNVVRELAAGKGFVFSDLGEITLRGFENPVRLYEARWREQATRLIPHAASRLEGGSADAIIEHVKRLLAGVSRQ